MLDRRSALLTVVLMPGLLSCISEQGTCQLQTDALVMWASISDLEGEVSVEVEFETFAADGAGTSVELCSNRDSLMINGEAAALVRAFGQYYYRATLPLPVETVEISLAREQHQSVSATVVMPPSFAITSPAPDSSHSRGAELAIAWEPSWPGHEMQVSIVDGIGSSCIEGLGYDDVVEDLGSHVVEPDSLVDGGAGADCAVTLLMSRELVASYPAELHEGGELRASVRRFHPLISTQ